MASRLTAAEQPRHDSFTIKSTPASAYPEMVTERRIPATELAQARFATSPLWETVASLRVLQSADARLHRPWVTKARSRLHASGIDLRRLLPLVPPSGYLADFLTPTPDRRYGDFTRELQTLRATPVDHIQRDLHHLETISSPDVLPALKEALTDPAAYLANIVRDLQAYWDAAIAADWPRLEALAEADIAWRLERLAAQGARSVFKTLHPRVRIDEQDLVINDYCETDHTDEGGIVLVPCAFAWPHLLLLTEPGTPPTMSYSPRGVGNLWSKAPDLEASALSDLIGKTRASAIQLLDLPLTTTQLACHLDISTATANAHLKTLERSALAERTRRGRRVLYQRTPLADALLNRRSHPTHAHTQEGSSPHHDGP